MSCSLSQANEPLVPGPEQQKGEPIRDIDHTMENMVRPVTSWIENKLHNNKTLQPRITNTTSQNRSGLSLRQAIKRAIEIYPGTVLSARKDGQHYQIKILSAKGIVQTLAIAQADTEAK